MARLPRFVLPGHPQHVIQRGNNRQNIFREEEDYEFYFEKLLAASRQHQCDVHAYVLMTNHVHLLITPHTEEGIGKMLQMIGRYYVQYFNKKYKRTGTLWEGRYKATLINSEQYLLSCMRYIEENPVRAKNMAKHPSEYYWSSYQCNAQGQYDELVVTQREYKKLAKTASGRQIAYRALFCKRMSNETLQQVREATNKAWVLGDDKFKRKIVKKLNRALESKGHGGDRKSEAYRIENKSTSLTP
ncbi:Transposase and inactivated derivatives [hydrothermal vent metagenome]|uniref:Transposase and inactivated derivatives n=1 Tax=hydrothermal vent metagenome TaxID=652676 RepID=A0A3B0XLR7_9ZZZZ